MGKPSLERVPFIAKLRGIACLAVRLTIAFAVHPSLAQKVYPYEPPAMDRFSTIYVDDGSCSFGKVLRVQGARRNQHRKKSCVPVNDLRVGSPAAAR